MRKHVWFRVVMAVWGLWFTAALSEAAGLHTCAMHGDHTASHAVQSHSAHGSGHNVPAHKVAKDCTCLGLCCGASIAMPRVDVDPARVSVLHDVAIASADAAGPRIIRAHALPFANGPPEAV